MSDSIEHSHRYSLSQTLMSNTLQYKASKGFRYISYICRCWLGGGGCVIIFGKFGGVRANLPLLSGGVLCNISPCKAHFSPPPLPPLLIIIAQSLKGRLHRALVLFLPDHYAMLMRPNKAETAVHGCHCSGDMAVRMRKILARPWVGVLVCHLLLFFFFFFHVIRPLERVDCSYYYSMRC